MEGVSLRLRAVLNLILQARKESISLEDDKNSQPRIVASGKSLEVNAMWRQMIADSSGLKVLLDRDTVEGTSRGVARLVASALSGGALLDEEEELGKVKTSKPRAVAKEFFDRAAVRQEEFLDAITHLYSQ